MVTFGVSTNKSSERYMMYVSQNLEHPAGLLEMFYKGTSRRHKHFWVLSIEPRVPEFYKLGFVFIITGVLLNPVVNTWSWLAFAPGLLMSASYIFWRSEFYYFLLTLGLKKHGGSGSRLVKGEELMSEVLTWVKLKSLNG